MESKVLMTLFLANKKHSSSHFQYAKENIRDLIVEKKAEMDPLETGRFSHLFYNNNKKFWKLRIENVIKKKIII